MIFDAVCKAGNFRINAENQPALLKEGTDCYRIIDYRELFKRKTKNVYLTRQTGKESQALLLSV